MRIGQNVSSFFLAKTDLTKNKPTNKVAAYMDKAAAFFLKPARDLFGGSSAKIKENKVTLKHQNMEYKAYISRGGKGGTIGKIAKVIALVPGLVIGGALELAPYLFDSSIRENKAETMSAELEAIQEKRGEHVQSLKREFKQIMQNSGDANFKKKP